MIRGVSFSLRYKMRFVVIWRIETAVQVPDRWKPSEAADPPDRKGLDPVGDSRYSV
jgi:hypothetical protein